MELSIKMFKINWKNSTQKMGYCHKTVIYLCYYVFTRISNFQLLKGEIMRLSMLNLLCICLVFIYGAITAAPAIAKQPKPDFSVESINEDHISLSFDDDKICKVYANEEAVYQYCKEITSHAFEQEIDAIIDDAIAYIPGRYNSTPAPYTPPRYVTINCPGLSLSFICE